jgi:hypothetical protein
MEEKEGDGKDKKSTGLIENQTPASLPRNILKR